MPPRAFIIQKSCHLVFLPLNIAIAVPIISDYAAEALQKHFFFFSTVRTKIGTNSNIFSDLVPFLILIKKKNTSQKRDVSI
jgi:hypothetical protein